MNENNLTFNSLKPIGLDFFDKANLRVETILEAKCTPEKLMETLCGDKVWSEWAPVIKQVDWTCEKPYKQGATRTVHLASKQAVKEVFFHWEEGKHIAFYVEEATIKGLESFAEDYIIEALDDGRTRLTWIVGMQLEGIGKLFIPLSRFAMKMTFKKWFKTYVKILEAS